MRITLSRFGFSIFLACFFQIPVMTFSCHIHHHLITLTPQQRCRQNLSNCILIRKLLLVVFHFLYSSLIPASHNTVPKPEQCPFHGQKPGSSINYQWAKPALKRKLILCLKRGFKNTVAVAQQMRLNLRIGSDLGKWSKPD